VERQDRGREALRVGIPQRHERMHRSDLEKLRQMLANEVRVTVTSILAPLLGSVLSRRLLGYFSNRGGVDAHRRIDR
jgi:uncharacterized protein (DUF2164 family)